MGQWCATVDKDVFRGEKRKKRKEDQEDLEELDM